MCASLSWTGLCYHLEENEEAGSWVKGWPWWNGLYCRGEGWGGKIMGKGLTLMKWFELPFGRKWWGRIIGKELTLMTWSVLQGRGVVREDHGWRTDPDGMVCTAIWNIWWEEIIGKGLTLMKWFELHFGGKWRGRIMVEGLTLMKCSELQERGGEWGLCRQVSD